MLDNFLFSTYQSITDYNIGGGFEAPFCYVNQVTGGLFIQLLLVAIFLIFSIGAYFMQKRSVGSGDFPASLAVAGFVTSVLAILLRLVKYNGVSCLVDGLSLSIVIIVSGIAVLYFLFSRD